MAVTVVRVPVRTRPPAGGVALHSPSVSTSQLTALDDVEVLLVRVGAGEREAMAALYDLTAQRLFGLVLRVVRDRGLAEETLQEVYLQVWQHAPSYRPDAGAAMSWLLTIAHRRAVDRVRSEAAATRRVEREAATTVRIVPDPAEDVIDNLDRDTNAVRVRSCLDDLTELQRESIELAYLAGRTYREVAEDLEVALPTVKSRIRDGLQRLRSCLGGDPR